MGSYKDKDLERTTPRRRKVWQHDTENISEDQIREYFHRLGWEVERFGRDYGEDLFIRIFEEGAFNGKAFYVQLKGTNNIQQYALKTGVFSYGVDVVNLLQWHRNKFPVIFVLWDIEQRVGYWLHIQSYVDKRLKKEPLWLKQEEGKRNIHIPSDQMIPWGEDDALLTLINAEQPLWQMLAEVKQRLDEADPHYRLEAHLTSTGTGITTVEKYPGAATDNPIKIKFTTSVPTDTEEGRDLVEKIKGFISSGVPVKVPLPYVKNLEFPEFINQALPEFTQDGSIIMGPAHNPKPLVIRIEITHKSGEQFTLEQVHLKVAQAGREEVTLTNDEQPMPIKVRLVLRTNGTFEMDFKFSDTQQVYQLLMQLRFQHFLSQPNTVRMISLETGLPLASATYTKGITEPPPAWNLQTLEALNAFQLKLGRLIAIPGRELTVDEMDLLEKLRRVFHEGKSEMTLNSFSSPIIPITSENRAELLQQLEPFAGGKAADFPLLLEDFVNLFDIDIPLGRIKPIYVKVKLANEQAVREKLSEQEDGEIQLTFVPSGDKTVVIEYLAWSKVKDEAAQ
ncbi:MAG TPA: DUF4365 domain-containing protein [Candidatus Acidoferrum sp.]|nr:DUF4365 domain-containing protein [Candidatus Acidoferrum sp.]